MPNWRNQIGYALSIFGIIVVALLLQTSVFSFFPLYGVYPNVTLVVVISFGLLRGPYSGLAFGFFTGLLTDVLSGQLIGLGGLICACLGLIAGQGGVRLVRESLFPAVVFCVFGTFGYVLAYTLGTSAFGIPLPIVPSIVNLAPPLIVYNTVIICCVHPGLRRLLPVLERLLFSSRSHPPVHHS